MTFHAFVVGTIGRSVDLYLDRLWLDTLAAAVGEFFPLTKVTWWYILFYTIVLTILGVFLKKCLQWVAGNITLFDFDKRTLVEEERELIIALGQNQ